MCRAHSSFFCLTTKWLLGAVYLRKSITCWQVAYLTKLFDRYLKKAVWHQNLGITKLGQDRLKSIHLKYKECGPFCGPLQSPAVPTSVHGRPKCLKAPRHSGSLCLEITGDIPAVAGHELLSDQALCHHCLSVPDHWLHVSASTNPSTE